MWAWFSQRLSNSTKPLMGSFTLELSLIYWTNILQQQTFMKIVLNKTHQPVYISI
jgi:hypothetical protein